ncbi:MAG: thioredoxin fold domain-containing protein [Paludibacteraceae bacterium]|nr:thioredoxin fold domain-containing protein [Paludibacteraceae bacterium]
MRKLMFLCLAALLLALPVQAEVQYLTTAQFKEKVFDYTKNRDWQYVGKRPAIIDFYTTWCGPCKRLAPIMETLSEKYKGRVIFYKVDTERERELAALFNISSIPQVLYIPMYGKPQILVGLYPQEQIEEIIEQFLLKPADKSKK